MCLGNPGLKEPCLSNSDMLRNILILNLESASSCWQVHYVSSCFRDEEGEGFCSLLKVTQLVTK